MKKVLSFILVSAFAMSLLAACSQPAPSSSASPEVAPVEEMLEGAINVVSREPGSGTRGAFVELVGVEVKDADGNKKDMTTEEAIVQQKTDAVLSSVESDKVAIGYISLGSMSERIKAVDIEGVAATAENVKNKSYKISRPFMIATKGEATGLAKDFIDYILSAEGQAIVTKGGYVSVVEGAKAYAGAKPSGKITVGGSSSVSPIMEKLAEGYKAMNTNATVEIQTTDSSAGMTGTSDGSLDIGMSSRELKDTEKEKLTGIEIALDGIAVIVNTTNPLKSLTIEQVRGIYTGEIMDWKEVK